MAVVAQIVEGEMRTKFSVLTLNEKNRILKIVTGKPCNMCGQPSSCAIFTGVSIPLCIDHGLQAQRLGEDVVFPKGRYHE